MTHSEPLRIGTAQEIPLQASKWLQTQLLVDLEEMQELFSMLGHFRIYLAGAICNTGQEEIEKSAFLKKYAEYTDHIKSGNIPDEKVYRALFSSVFSVASDHLYQVPISENRSLIRITKPVVQLQMNKIAYSEADGKFRAMVFSQDSFFWGLQFSYPQLYQDAITKEIFTVRESEQFPNTALYNRIRKWIRTATIPTPFLVNGVKTNVPMRLGKKSLAWIDRHCQLKEKKITVSVKNC